MAEDTDVPDISEMSIREDRGAGAEDARRLTASLLSQLRATVDQRHNRATFACGGAVPIVPAARAGAAQEGGRRDGRLTSAPVTVRWDPARGSAPAAGCKITFPLEPATEGNLDALVQACTPAATGGPRGAALRMEPTAFSTNFNPYELGIIDTVAQLLLPSQIDSRTYRSVRAELRGMNVYTGSSGRFPSRAAPAPSRPGDTHFGTLVVCLPLEHEGGQLQVRHRGKEMTFDWSTRRDEADHATVRWAAFYGDCEHEVLGLLSGRRVVLSYALHAARGNGVMAGRSPALDPSYLPLYQFVESMLREEKFMPAGGYLGFFCTHPYPHTNPDHTILPDALRGLDMVLWETFRSLDLRVELRPVVMCDDDDDDEGDGPAAAAVLGTDFEVHLADAAVAPGRAAEAALLGEWAAKGEPLLRVGYGDVCWLTPPRHEELQVVYVARGEDDDDPGMDNKYSHCAIVVEVPAFGKRIFE